MIKWFLILKETGEDLSDPIVFRIYALTIVAQQILNFNAQIYINFTHLILLRKISQLGGEGQMKCIR